MRRLGARIPAEDSIGCPFTAGFPGQPGPPPRVTYAAATPSVSIDDGWLCGSDMTHLTAMTAAHALDRLTDWQTALRAENKAPRHSHPLRPTGPPAT
jgi:hypothetical protein